MLVFSMLGVAIFALVAGAISDLRHRILPDWISGVTALSGAVVALANGHLFVAATVALALFVIGAAAFRFALMGGGDVKLIAAMGFWLTPATLPSFLLIMALTGGALGLAMLGYRAVAGPTPGDAPPMTVPYGVAIAVSGLFILFGAQ